MKRGFFVSIEGGEGAGKSAQVKILARSLRQRGYKVIVTREPGGTRIGEQIRAITHNPKNTDLDPTTEAYLMAAARAQHVREKILPAIRAGKIVISDRFVDSSIAYQGYGRGLGAEVVADLNELAVNGAIPDLVLILDVPLEVGLARRNNTRKKDRLDMQKKNFYERVIRGYLDLAKKNPKHYVVIDAAKSTVEVAQEIWKVVTKTLG